MNEELLAALKEWAEACKAWDDLPGHQLIDVSEADLERCNEAAKRLRALAEKLP